MYGCMEMIPCPDLSVPSHQTSCKFHCVDFKADALWGTIIKYQKENPTFKPDIWGNLASKASKYTSVPMHNAAHPTDGKTPVLFQSSELWDDGEPPYSRVHDECLQFGMNVCLIPIFQTFLSRILHRILLTLVETMGICTP